MRKFIFGGIFVAAILVAASVLYFRSAGYFLVRDSSMSGAKHAICFLRAIL